MDGSGAAIFQKWAEEKFQILVDSEVLSKVSPYVVYSCE